MKKIPTLFVRDEKRPQFVTRELAPECAWVAAGEGIATRKFDGTACLVHGGKLYKRLEWSSTKGPPPVNWVHHSFDPTALGGHGWLLLGDGPEDRRHLDAWNAVLDRDGCPLPDGTYELVGPNVGRNPEGVAALEFIRHGHDEIHNVARDFDSIAYWLSHHPMEGIVWHHPDGRMVKIKARDFGIPWPRPVK